MGLDAGLALGGATLDLTPSYEDGRVDLFRALDAALALGGTISELIPSKHIQLSRFDQLLQTTLC